VKRRPKSQPTAVGRVLPDVLRELGLGEAATGARISAAWAEIVGAEAAAHSWPAALHGGTLEVAVDASAWAQHLQLRRPELLAALSARLGPEAPRALRLRIGRGSRSGA
jgi:predicted nucleic acid-binding Zn ribbon protein